MTDKCDDIRPLTQFEMDMLGEDYDAHRELEKKICINHHKLLIYAEKNRTEFLTVEESVDVDDLLFEVQIWAGQLVKLREDHGLFGKQNSSKPPGWYVR